MKRIWAVVLAALVCAILIGVGGTFALLSQNTESAALMGDKVPVRHVQSESFCDPLVDPTCQPPPPPPPPRPHGIGDLPCDPLVDPTCQPPSPPGGK